MHQFYELFIYGNYIFSFIITELFLTSCYIFYKDWKKLQSIFIFKGKIEQIYIKGSKTFVYEYKERSDQCLICFDKFDSDDNVCVLKCKGRHIYHKNCIYKWWTTKTQKSENVFCPTCKEILFKIKKDI